MFRKREPEPNLFESNRIDLVALSPDGESVELHIVRDKPWSGNDQELASFQGKIQTYVSYAVDGQMYVDYPETRGLEWVIVVTSYAGSPDARTEQVIGVLKERIPAHGGRIVSLLKSA